MSQVRGQSYQAVWPKLVVQRAERYLPVPGKEHPQTAAFVLSKASPSCSAGVTAVMPADQRDEVMRRMVSISNITSTALRLLETTLNDELLVAARRDTGPDIHARMADIINKMEREQMDGVLQSLLAHRPKEAKIVKGLLFTFDDITRITQEARLKLFDQVAPERLIIALKNCEGPLKELILSSVAARSRRMIESELQAGAPSSQKDILKTRRAIADLALEMAERGEIEITREMNNKWERRFICGARDSKSLPATTWPMRLRGTNSPLKRWKSFFASNLKSGGLPEGRLGAALQRLVAMTKRGRGARCHRRRPRRNGSFRSGDQRRLDA